MDSQHTEQLYERFPELYRERTAPLKSSGMAWGFQCGNGWYKIIYEMSQKIQKLSVGGEFAPAITQVSKHEDGTLHVEARNITPPIQDVIATAREASRLTCEVHRPKDLHHPTARRRRRCNGVRVATHLSQREHLLRLFRPR